MPLDVDKGIELPQLELISTKNDDCTTEYSTGTFPPAPDPLPPATFYMESHLQNGLATISSDCILLAAALDSQPAHFLDGEICGY